MDFKKLMSNLLHYSQKMLTEPKQFWDLVSPQKDQINIFLHVYGPYVVLAALAESVGYFLSSSELLFSYGIMTGLRKAVLFVCQYFLAVYVVDKLVKHYGGSPNPRGTRMLVGFSLLPFLMVAVITGLIPFLYIAHILILYGFYLLYTGIPKFYDIPAEKLRAFLITVILSVFFKFIF